MIVKMIILRFLGSSDDKEREDMRSKARRAAPTGVMAAPWKLFGSGALEEPMHVASVHPMVVGSSDALASVQV